jgi:hypothetical protein
MQCYLVRAEIANGSTGDPSRRAQGATSCKPFVGAQNATPGEKFKANLIDYAMRRCLGGAEIVDRSRGDPSRKTQGTTSCRPSLGGQNATPWASSSKRI